VRLSDPLSSLQFLLHLNGELCGKWDSKVTYLPSQRNLGGIAGSPPNPLENMWYFLPALGSRDPVQ
jgi:hypothetical protein